MPKFWKLEGAGNDFIFGMSQDTDRPLASKQQSHEALAKKLCDRHKGVGADGLVLLRVEFDPDPIVVWDFYNDDGSEASMCGNAARCVGVFCSEILGMKQRFRLITKSGPVWIENVDGRFAVTAQWPRIFARDQKLLDGRVNGVWVDTGVPHFVIRKDGYVQDTSLAAMSREIQKHDLFAKDGVNVTWFSKGSNEGQVRAVTFERGVENFTLACGTGAVAAAFVARLLDPRLSASNSTPEMDVEMPGGTLRIQIDQAQQRIIQSGPARIVFEGSLAKTV